MTAFIREPQLSEEKEFLLAMQASQTLHHPWVKAPLTPLEFKEYMERSEQPNNKHYLIFTDDQHIAGVFNISNIVMGLFQSAYLGFYAVEKYPGKGHMRTGLKLVLEKVFNELKLHRIEANIQPENAKSIGLVLANGFKKEGYSPRYLKINNEWRDHERYAITYEDWC